MNVPMEFEEVAVEQEVAGKKKRLQADGKRRLQEKVVVE